jgi:hypothetical protein
VTVEFAKRSQFSCFILVTGFLGLRIDLPGRFKSGDFRLNRAFALRSQFSGFRLFLWRLRAGRAVPVEFAERTQFSSFILVVSMARE